MGTQLEFFVYLVESPSAPDLYHRRTEGQVLAEALRLAGINCVTRCAISREAFCAALQIGLPEEMVTSSPRIPLLHISSHGDAEGIQLSSKETISWADLGLLLAPINSALKNQLVVAMSCCDGYSGIRMAMRTDESPLPFFALIGSWQKPTWSDTVVAFSAFYHQLHKGMHVREAVQAMSTASGCNFAVEWAEEQKKQYLDFLKNYNPDAAVRQLATATPIPTNEAAKFAQPSADQLQSVA